MTMLAHKDRGRGALVARLASLLGAAALCWSATGGPAAAQLSWFGRPEASAQDAYDAIQSHGFRLVGPMMQNRDVYIADVIDRRRRRERLIISRESGAIVQRFLVETGPAAPYAALPDSPDGGPLSARQKPSGDFFSRIVRGFNDDGDPRPPSDIDGAGRQDAVEPRTLPRPQRMTRPRNPDIDPHLATRHDDAPVTSRPLAPEPTPSQPAVTPAPTTSPPPAAAAPSAAPSPKPAVAAIPPASPQTTVQPSTPASAPPARATVVNSDPLRIPGQKEPEKAKPATTAAAKPAAPAPVKPSGDVPVAPLD